MAGTAQQAHLDVLARQMGYHDYATYSAYQAHQQAMRTDNGLQGTGYDATGGAQQPQQTNWLQNLINKIPIHPAYLLGKVNDAFTQAGQ